MILQSFPLNRDEYIGAEVVQLWHYGRTTGVFSADENLRVKVKSGMTISVEAGVGWLSYSKFGGVVFCNPTTTEFQLDIADGLLKRIDRLVVSYDILNNKIEMKVKKGSFSSAPVAQALVRNESFYEIALADILVDKGALAITQGNITDQRLNESLCGLVKNSVDSIPSQSLQDKYLVDFQKWFDGVKETLDQNTAGNLLNMIQGQETAVKQVASSLQTGYFQITASLTNTSWTANIRQSVWTINKNVMDCVFKGSKIWYETTTGKVYAIVVDITATKITLFHQDGTTSLPIPSTSLINIGTTKYPTNFPSKSQWKVRGTLSTAFSKNSPVVNTNYLVFSQLIGIGEWELNVQGNMKATGGTSSIAAIGVGIGSPTTASKKFSGSSSTVNLFIWGTYSHQEIIQISTQSTYGYYIQSCASANTSIGVDGETYGVFMEFTSAYA